MAESVTITDNRTGESLEIPIVDGGVDSSQWKKLLGNTWFYDPAYTQTAATSSAPDPRSAGICAGGGRWS